ncbi:MAG TPA: rod shape-determining protein MreC, partial [Bacteroidales bacterium]|nr:rod shape-determining protein MreC [Bacteroidales bacterium]
GKLYTWNMGVSEYFFLRQANHMLVNENARLREMLKEPHFVSDTAKFVINDSVAPQQFTYIPARVISNSINKRNNYLMLDKGRKHGVDREMAVISPDGVVGIVVNVSENYAWVMSVLNKNSRINARLTRNNYQGSLTWDGHDYRIGMLSDVPSHAHIEKGDTVVTSGYSLMFPGNIMIGTVEDFFIERGDHFYTLKLNFSVDYNRLSHVYVVNNLMRDEQMSIIEEIF